MRFIFIPSSGGNYVNTAVPPVNFVCRNVTGTAVPPYLSALTVYEAGTEAEAAAQAGVTGSPIPSQLSPAAKAFLTAQAAKRAALGAALNAALIAQFNAWTPVQRAVMNGPRLAIADMLAAGDLTDAIAAISEYPLPDPSYAVLQAAILADLTTYAPLFAAVAAATTIAEVSAVKAPA